MLDYLENNVVRWAIQRNLIKGCTPRDQFAKLVEEVGELSKEITRGTQEGQTQELGDCLVLLIIIAQQLDLDLEICLEAAYNKIKDRKGTMINGVFVKEQDL